MRYKETKTYTCSLFINGKKGEVNELIRDALRADNIKYTLIDDFTYAYTLNSSRLASGERITISVDDKKLYVTSESKYDSTRNEDNVKSIVKRMISFVPDKVPKRG